MGKSARSSDKNTDQAKVIHIRHRRLYLNHLKRRAHHALARRRHGGSGRLLKNVTGESRGRRCLLVHLTDPFIRPGVDVRHQNRWQARELARLASAAGFQVDVMDIGCGIRPDERPYDLVIDLHPGLTPGYESACTPKTRRIAYITGSNPSFSNRAEMDRIDSIESRYGKRLLPRRQVPEFSQQAFDACCGFFFIGNRVNLNTYDEFRLPPVHFIRNFAYPVEPVDHSRRSATDFLFLASGGQAHKGLDRLLEVFSRRSDWTLHVCSAFHEESDFCRLFGHLLFGRKNIVPHGFLPLDSSGFRHLAARCSLVVLPSCSEANAGSVLSGIAAGLVPVVSRECGFESDEVHYLTGIEREAIEETLERISSRGTGWLVSEARRIGDLVNARYTPSTYTESVGAALAAVIP